MRIAYDKEADAAYIYIQNTIHDGESSQQVALIETPSNESQVTLDFDEDGFLLGVEILQASKALRGSLLAKCPAQ